jgi:hypothetical protein
MKAEDIKPNRLDKAKLTYIDLYQQLKGDRIGLIISAVSLMFNFRLQQITLPQTCF